MKQALVLVALVFCSVIAAGQNVRYRSEFPSVSSNNPPFLVANLPPNSPTIAVCHSPANAVPCTNYVTTFTGLGAACPNGAQDTPDPNASTSACQPTGDAQGNIGFWAPAGTYDYTVCIQNNCFGPYTVTLGSSGGGGGIPNAVVQFTNALSASIATGFIAPNMIWECWDANSPANTIYPSNVSINPTTFVATFTFLQNQSGYCVVNGNDANITLGGNNVFTGINTFTNAGVFTNTQMNDYLSVLLNACTPANVQNEIGIFDTDAVLGCILVPASSTVVQSDALAGYIVTQSANTNAVGAYTVAKAGVNNSFVWGINPVASDTSYLGSFTGVTINNEFDMGVTSTTTQGNGIMLTGVSTVNNPNIVGVNVLHGSGSHPIFNIGFSCGPGATVSGTCMNVNPQASGANQASQIVQFVSETAGAAFPVTQFFQDAPGNMHITATSPGILEVNNGIGANNGSLATLTGTGACATITTQTGGLWAGSAKCTGTTGASTLTITPGATAPNGWVCNVQDETTRANLFQQSSHTTGACVLTIASVTQNDVFVFSAFAF